MVARAAASRIASPLRWIANPVVFHLGSSNLPCAPLILGMSYFLMRLRESVTLIADLTIVIFLILSIALILILRRHFAMSPQMKDHGSMIMKGWPLLNLKEI